MIVKPEFDKVGDFSEGLAAAKGLNFVVDGCAGSVGVYIVDVGWAEAGVLHSHLDAGDGTATNASIGAAGGRFATCCRRQTV